MLRPIFKCTRGHLFLLTLSLLFTSGDQATQAPVDVDVPPVIAVNPLQLFLESWHRDPQSGYYYKVFPAEILTHDAALEYCTTLDLTLPVPEHQGTNKFISDLSNRFDEIDDETNAANREPYRKSKVWLGMTRNASIHRLFRRDLGTINNTLVTEYFWSSDVVNYGLDLINCVVTDPDLDPFKSWLVRSCMETAGTMCVRPIACGPLGTYTYWFYLPMCIFFGIEALIVIPLVMKVLRKDYKFFYDGYWDEEDDYDDGAGYDGFFGFGIGSGERPGGPGAGGTWDKKRGRRGSGSSFFSITSAMRKGMTFWQWLLYQARRAARAAARAARAVTGSQPDDRRRRR